MFQAARPPLIWSSEAKRRATWNGASKVVEPVAIRPMCSVTMASADSRVNGSNEVTVWLRFSAFDRHVEHGQVVGHEERVEPAALQRLDEALDVREVEVGVRVRAGIAPGSGVDGGRPHEGAEMELTFGGHGVSVRIFLGIVRCLGMI